MIRIILIRHGRTAWNAVEGRGKRFRGLVDLPLANEGVRQAQITAQRLAGIPLTGVYSSPLQRAAHTAQLIAESQGFTAQPLPGLRSMDYGQWAGLFDTEVARRWPVAYRQWRHDPYSVEIPGGESAVELRNRISAALRTVLSSHTDGDTIALVSHQVVTKTLVCVLLGLPNTAYWSVRQDLCNLTCFDYNPGNDEVTLVSLNDTYHLGPTLPRAAGSGTGIILIRHGQTAWNVGAGEERFRGRTDLPLDATGHTQARAVASRLGRERPAALFASPLLRTQQTMAPLAQELGLPVQVHEGLLDINYGKFQGMTHSEAAVAYPEHYTLWWTRPSMVRFPGGESLVDVQTRLLALLQELAARYPDQTISLVGHQIVNKVLACTLLGLDLDHIWRIQQDTCGLDVFQRTDDNWKSLCINDTGHLH